MAEQRQCITITLEVPIWHRFRALCALQGKDDSAVVKALINVYLAQKAEPTRAAIVAKGGF